jgi:hypothetical protein
LYSSINVLCLLLILRFVSYWILLSLYYSLSPITAAAHFHFGRDSVPSFMYITKIVFITLFYTSSFSFHKIKYLLICLFNKFVSTSKLFQAWISSCTIIMKD